MQMTVLLVLALMLSFKSVVLAYSALLGGLICIAPSAYFARFAFKYSGAKATVKVAQSFYLGEAGKFVLTAVLFAIVFIVVDPLNAGILFITYTVIVLVGLVSAHVVIGR